MATDPIRERTAEHAREAARSSRPLVPSTAHRPTVSESALRDLAEAHQEVRRLAAENVELRGQLEQALAELEKARNNARLRGMLLGLDD